MLACANRRGTVRRIAGVPTLLVGFFLFLLTAAGGAIAQPPKLEVEGDSGAGHLRLSWEIEGTASESELEMADNPAFDGAMVRYRGQHRASVLSGLRDGENFFRVRTHSDGQPSEWSNVVSFPIQHHGHDFALLLLSAGALVFLATLGFLLFFARRGQHD